MDIRSHLAGVSAMNDGVLFDGLPYHLTVHFSISEVCGLFKYRAMGRYPLQGVIVVRSALATEIPCSFRGYAANLYSHTPLSRINKSNQRLPMM